MARPVTSPWSSALRWDSDEANVPGTVAAAMTTPTPGALLRAGVRPMPRIVGHGRDQRFILPVGVPAPSLRPSVGPPTSGAGHDDDDAPTGRHGGPRPAVAGGACRGREPAAAAAVEVAA